MLFQRKSTYHPLVYKPDFFITKHIHSFIEYHLKNFLHARCSVIDIGCGEQPWRKLIESHDSCYIGTDIVQNAQGNVDIVSDITQIPVAANKFDIVLCSEVLEHVADTADAVMELARITKPGGHIILTTPFCYPLHEEPFDFVRLTPYNIALQAKDNGLEIRILQTMGNEIEVIATIIDHMWAKMYPSPQPLAYKVVKLFSRVSMNIGARQLSKSFAPLLPATSYLSVQSVLQKPSLL